MKLGIFGGTFDPPHLGHLVLAQEAYEQFNLDMVAFMPTWQPPHRRPVSDFDTRFRLCSRAFTDDARFALFDTEQRYKLRYSVDALRMIQEWGRDELFLIMGGDQAGNFFTWHKPDQILELAIPIVAERTLYDRARIIDHWGDYSHLLNFVEVPPVDISSSEIRHRRAQGQSIQYLVPRKVETLINEQRLYRDGQHR